jgi:hypothetical protein
MIETLLRPPRGAAESLEPMSSRANRAIDEIEERLQDLGEALREAGAPDIAEGLERLAQEFTEPTRVRRSVNAIRAKLESWRTHGGDLPDTPKVSFAANRLEDACREALSGGVIVAAPATLAAQSRRKLAIVLATLLCGGLALLIPIALVEAGVDFSDLAAERKTAPLRLPRGEEDSVKVAALAESQLPESTRGVEFAPLGACKEALRNGATCAEAPPRLWPQGRLPTYELKLRHQAYGLLFALVDGQVGGGRFGEARLLLAATDETPEGRYEIPLAASYLGYTPQACEMLQKLQGECPRPRVGEGERHDGVAVPIVIVDVVPGDPSRRLGEKRLEQAEAEEARHKAQERAQQIAAAVTEIESVLSSTEKMIAKKRWEEARGNVQKLALLFQPLEGADLRPGDDDLVPASVGEVRGRFEAMRDKLDEFEGKVFEQTFTLVTAESNRRVPEDSLLARLAKQFRVTPGYVQEIYTSRADEIARRLEAKSQAHIEKLKAEQHAREERCGPLPTRAWSTVDRYIREVYAEPRVEIALGECMTPRLTENDCWEMRCDYQRKVEVAVERPKVVTKHEVTIYLMQNRVLRHE